MNRMRYLKDVVTLQLDTETCIGCGMCTIVCPHEVFAIDNGSARIHDRDLCMECGACATNCPVGAITVKTGVGCANAVINSVLGRKKGDCCCVIEPNNGQAKQKQGSNSVCC